MPGIREVRTLESVYYGSGSEILNRFLLPVLSQSKRYDRISGYFNIEALLSVSQGLDRLYEHKGSMRLAVGIHDFPKDAASAVAESERLESRVERIRSEIVEGISALSNALLKDRLATLALMISDGFLTIKVVDTIRGRGIFHSKVLIMRDENGDSVAAMGSVNETSAGLGDNHENLMVMRSWADPEGVRKQQDIFDNTWDGLDPDLIVLDLTEELAQDIAEGLGPDYVEAYRERLKQRASLSATLDMPSYFFVSGAIPALYHHQERAVIDGLSRWPVRVLYADEVGLGKTFEVAATIAFLVKYCGVSRTVILTPKSVLTQWRDELKDNFGIEGWCYDSASRRYVDCSGNTRQVRNNCPLGKDMPPVALISAQYARGTGKDGDVFSRPGTILPEVLAVDEAHAARVSLDVGERKKTTKLYQTLKGVVDEIPHVIFATATPMQKDAIEYLSLLNLLGLPGHWDREKAFNLSLRVIASEEIPSLNDCGTAAALLLEVVDIMQPARDLLDSNDADLIDGLRQCSNRIGMGSLAQRRWDEFKSLFVKLHPARLLTVRNTRRSLEEIGYVFPKRKLWPETLYGNQDVTMFYDRVNRYVGSTYLGVEKVLYPERVFSDGFVKSSYQQRMASSLYSCGKSLARRKSKLETLRKLVGSSDRSHWSISSDLSEEDEDEALLTDKEMESVKSAIDEADALQVTRAINSELIDVASLLGQLGTILTKCGDPKVDRSVDIALQKLAEGDQVLVFSRYTDTVDALLARWRKVAQKDVMFGVYTGAGATVTNHGKTKATTKDEIKALLNAGDLKIMFCSDAASEGLNLQAARVLINVDVPWTPARLEQRIGRVARLGQKAASVQIINVWFPKSVEERMYTRINERLEAYNLTIGEFPEVVAESIRRSILESSAHDESVRMLQDIRNSLQIEALHALWASDVAGETASRVFRSTLLEDVCRVATCDAEGGDTVVVHLHDGTTEVVTADERAGDTISLSSRCVRESFPYVQGYRIAVDGDGRRCAFVNDGGWLEPEALAGLLGGAATNEVPSGTEKPKWLPDPARLTLGFAVKSLSPRPRLWPPKERDRV